MEVEYRFGVRALAYWPSSTGLCYLLGDHLSSVQAELNGHRASGPSRHQLKMTEGRSPNHPLPVRGCLGGSLNRQVQARQEDPTSPSRAAAFVCGGAV
jgi:hypothetical protein